MLCPCAWRSGCALPTWKACCALGAGLRVSLPMPVRYYRSLRHMGTNVAGCCTAEKLACSSCGIGLATEVILELSAKRASMWVEASSSLYSTAFVGFQGTAGTWAARGAELSCGVCRTGRRSVWRPVMLDVLSQWAHARLLLRYICLALAARIRGCRLLAGDCLIMKTAESRNQARLTGLCGLSGVAILWEVLIGPVCGCSLAM